MEKRQFDFEGRTITLYQEPSPQLLLIQPVDEHDVQLMDSQWSHFAVQKKVPAALCAFSVKDWNADLSPWEAPPVFGKEPFGGRGADTLTFITDALLPRLREELGELPALAVGGYSLAGLFALWCGYETDLFPYVSAASPSVWFPGWREYAESRQPKAKHIYLSLGDEEERTRNPVMARVGDNLRAQYELLKRDPAVETFTLEWNEGNHFRDSDLRTARGFAWLSNILSDKGEGGKH